MIQALAPVKVDVLNLNGLSTLRAESRLPLPAGKSLFISKQVDISGHWAVTEIDADPDPGIILTPLVLLKHTPTDIVTLFKVFVDDGNGGLTALPDPFIRLSIFETGTIRV